MHICANSLTNAGAFGLLRRRSPKPRSSCNRGAGARGPAYERWQSFADGTFHLSGSESTRAACARKRPPFGDRTSSEPRGRVSRAFPNGRMRRQFQLGPAFATYDEPHSRPRGSLTNNSQHIRTPPFVRRTSDQLPLPASPPSSILSTWMTSVWVVRDGSVPSSRRAFQPRRAHGLLREFPQDRGIGAGADAWLRVLRSKRT
jgi:hypothetical protein